MDRGGACELLNRCAMAGEAEDWEEFVERYRHRLTAGIRRRIDSPVLVVTSESREAERFRDELVKRTQFLKVGPPLAKDTDLGALVSKAHMEKVQSYLSLAEVEGGKILCGGTVANPGSTYENGYYLRPAVIEGLPIDCRTNQEEIFGPVVSIAPFDTEAEALELANGTPYGLSATLWTQDVSRAHRMAEHLQAGIVWVNCWMLRDLRTPFGGMKQSGVGREGGQEALRFFTEPKNVCVKYR